MQEDKPRSMVWTAITERLPEEAGRYLVTEEFAYMRLVTINVFLTEYMAGCFTDKKRYSGAGFYDPEQREKNDFVIAWAELPDAYEGGISE